MDKYKLIKVLESPTRDGPPGPPTSAGSRPSPPTSENFSHIPLKVESGVSDSLSDIKKRILNTLPSSLRNKGARLLSLLPPDLAFQDTSLIYNGDRLSTPVGLMLDYLLNHNRVDRPPDVDQFLKLLKPVSLLKKLVPIKKLAKSKVFKVKKSERKTTSKKKRV